MEHLVTIELFGQPYTFKTQSEIGQAKEVVDFLVKEVAKIENSQLIRTASKNHVAIIVLAALNIAKEYMDLKQLQAELRHTISDRSTSIIRKLEACCALSEDQDAFNLKTDRP